MLTRPYNIRYLLSIPLGLALVAALLAVIACSADSTGEPTITPEGTPTATALVNPPVPALMDPKTGEPLSLQAAIEKACTGLDTSNYDAHQSWRIDEDVTVNTDREMSGNDLRIVTMIYESHTTLIRQTENIMKDGVSYIRENVEGQPVKMGEWRIEASVPEIYKPDPCVFPTANLVPAGSILWDLEVGAIPEEPVYTRSVLFHLDGTLAQVTTNVNGLWVTTSYSEVGEPNIISSPAIVPAITPGPTEAISSAEAQPIPEITEADILAYESNPIFPEVPAVDTSGGDVVDPETSEVLGLEAAMRQGCARIDASHYDATLRRWPSWDEENPPIAWVVGEYEVAREDWRGVNSYYVIGRLVGKEEQTLKDGVSYRRISKDRYPETMGAWELGGDDFPPPDPCESNDGSGSDSDMVRIGPRHFAPKEGASEEGTLRFDMWIDENGVLLQVLNWIEDWEMTVLTYSDVGVGNRITAPVNANGP